MDTLEPVAMSGLQFGTDGLVPVIAQDASTGEVLMLASANREALARTLSEGRAWYFSRSRGKLWCKGETSGNTQQVVEVRCDCDGDAVLYRVRPRGPACHTGRRSCFHRSLFPAGRGGRADHERPDCAMGEPPPEAAGGTAGRAGPEILTELTELLYRRYRERPAGSYTAALFSAGSERIAQKVGEEAVEVVVAAARGARGQVVAEAADLVFHLLVLLIDAGIDPVEVCGELSRRRS
ncbi:MAG: bifunctional phosphoribosyl-AMP cyclohydrolase/phosphoribosyl-ATP diphosphatase HisIE [Bacillota bacterium]|nr:bifunctional phosphoribosyl-AMP cyclohydrolase/phosphoribosyl-ATP diphosphatase HisIE [Bacillota bacterium]